MAIMGTAINQSTRQRHPALRARWLRLANAWRHWRARGGELALQAFGVLGLLVLLGLFAGANAWRRAPELVQAFVDYRGALVLAHAALVAGAAYRQGLRWRRECERGLWAALPIAPARHRRAFDGILSMRWGVSLAGVLGLLGFAAWRVASFRAEVISDAALFAISSAIALIVARVLIWRAALDAPRAPPRWPRSPALTRLAARLEHPRLRHVVRWQRAAARERWVGGRAIPVVGLLCLSVPMGTPLITGALLFTAFVVMVAGYALLAGALDALPRLARLTLALPVSARGFQNAGARYPASLIAAIAILLGILLRLLGLPTVAVLGFVTVLSLWNALRLVVTLLHVHAPEQATRYLTVVGVLCVALASVQPLAAPLVLVVEVTRQFFKLRRSA